MKKLPQIGDEVYHIWRTSEKSSIEKGIVIKGYSDTSVTVESKQIEKFPDLANPSLVIVLELNKMFKTYEEACIIHNKNVTSYCNLLIEDGDSEYAEMYKEKNYIKEK